MFWYRLNDFYRVPRVRIQLVLVVGRVVEVDDALGALAFPNTPWNTPFRSLEHAAFAVAAVGSLFSKLLIVSIEALLAMATP